MLRSAFVPAKVFRRLKVYGDTDSVFVNTKTANFQQATSRLFSEMRFFNSSLQHLPTLAGDADRRTNQAIGEQEALSGAPTLFKAIDGIWMDMVQVQETRN